MTEIENKFLLSDRIQKIQSINKMYDLENNAYLSFSGGKDSTVLHYLIDEALPGNNIPRLFLNTGIEYIYILEFVKELAKKDSRIIIHNVGKNIQKTLQEVGYPFKSKEYSFKLSLFQNSGFIKTVEKYLDEDNNFGCPKKLKYQFSNNFKIKISNKCCNEFKKKPASDWASKNNKFIKITGMRREEGGYRKNMNCILLKNNNLKAFHPLSVITEEFENWYLEKNNIKLCKLYYPPYNFKRTGCKGCPFALNLQEELNVMSELLPNERKQCEILWKPVYDEYRKIGYRLRKNYIYPLFD